MLNLSVLHRDMDEDYHIDLWPNCRIHRSHCLFGHSYYRYFEGSFYVFDILGKQQDNASHRFHKCGDPLYNSDDCIAYSLFYNKS